MPKLSTKLHLLDQAGFRYNFDRMMYVNPTAKKAFSYEFVDDHSEDVIENSIQEVSDAQRWKFYFNAPPAEGVKLDLERAFG